jgi:predicted ATPase/DNA-binding CsgD family transcriptional regulator
MTNTGTGITRREREVLSLVAAHLTNREIAERLHVSVRTVESHVSALMGKLQLADRRALARHEASLDAAAPRWPAPLSSFVGRETECAALLEVVTAHRMVTATGPGGVGKTRLALRVVEAFAATHRDGGRFVDLVHVTDPAMVLSAVAAATGVAAPLGGSLAEALAASLADSDAVLLLDNCEHVIDAVRDGVSRLLAACPKLAIVATSRVPLRAPFEWLFPVPGLSMDEAGGDAIALFVERARAAGVQKPLDPRRVGELCASLDGMALAIELAAARCRALGLDGLIAGLDRGLRLLSSGDGQEHRHRSLRDAIGWSYRLLSAPDRQVFDAISVFASWFDVDAALAIVGGATQRFNVADALARLAEHSLLLVAPGEPTRYRALETLRQFGAEQLDQLGLRDAAADRHRQWCLAALGALATQDRDDAWCGRLDSVAADVRAALAWAAGRPGASDATSLAERLAEQLLLRGRPHESQRCYEQAAALADAAVERARLLRLAAGAAAARLVGQETLRLLDEAASIALAAGDGSAAAEDLAWTAIYLRYAPGIIAVVHEASESEQRLDRARSHATDAAAEATIAVGHACGLADDDTRTTELIAHALTLAREAGRPLVESLAYDRLCVYHLRRAEYASAIEACDLRGALLDRVALDASSAFQFNDHLLMISGMHLAAGHLREAALYADRLAELACYRDYPHPALARRIKVDAMAGDFDAAVERGERFLAAWERAGRPVSATMNVSAYAMAMVHGLLGDDARRAAWVEVAMLLTPATRRSIVFARGWAMVLDALLALDRGDTDTALARQNADLDDPTVWDNFVSCMWRPWYAALWAEAAVLGGHPDADERLQRAAVATRDNQIAAAIVKRASDLFHGKRKAVRSHAQAFARLGCDYQRRRTEALAIERA